VRGKSTLPPDIRELAILRVAWRNGAGYEWAAHLPAARAAGLGDAGIAALRPRSRTLARDEAAGLAGADPGDDHLRRRYRQSITFPISSEKCVSANVAT
jgi:hypothetical protein